MSGGAVLSELFLSASEGRPRFEIRCLSEPIYGLPLPDPADGGLL